MSAFAAAAGDSAARAACPNANIAAEITRAFVILFVFMVVSLSWFCSGFVPASPPLCSIERRDLRGNGAFRRRGGGFRPDRQAMDPRDGGRQVREHRTQAIGGLDHLPHLCLGG